MAAIRINGTCRIAGRLTMLPTWAATIAAKRYWPSTPMLNRFMRNPMAAATPDRYSGVARLKMSTWVSSFEA